ncbi:hypothetical protein D3C76_693420 [compost metagenome]
MRKTVTGTNDERIESVLGIEQMGLGFFTRYRWRRGHLLHYRLGRLVFLNHKLDLNLFSCNFINRSSYQFCITTFQPFYSKGCRRRDDKGLGAEGKRLRCLKPGIEARLA